MDDGLNLSVFNTYLSKLTNNSIIQKQNTELK